MFAALIHPITIFVSLSTATGVLMHDTRLDKVATSAIAPFSATANYEGNTKVVNFASDLHTHSERTSLTQAVHDLKTQSPRIQPRSSEDKKHMLQKHVARGHHAFDSYNLPIV